MTQETQQSWEQQVKPKLIAINPKRIFGIEPRSSPTLESDITASDLGIGGIGEINRPDINPSSGLVLPTEIVDTRLIAQGCGAGRGVATSKFIATGGAAYCLML
ncbi:MAG: hypothetical protein KME05_00490 [Gloeocapsa sp. UFS-A4-WI-NPMV-4B04]|nr:hypothetical protein [Gloeocapsa sp. UFS-A4-WI-NPMV-4B04]